MKFSRRIFVDPSSLTPRPLLLQAETALQKALSEDARNPFIHQLLASCYYNLASATRDEGDQESAASYSAKYVASLIVTARGLSGPYFVKKLRPTFSCWCGRTTTRRFDSTLN
ncbi:MAG: hypothetical protein ABGX22_00140 [Pirellulaceae bacterium]